MGRREGGKLVRRRGGILTWGKGSESDVYGRTGVKGNALGGGVSESVDRVLSQVRLIA